MLAGPAAVHAAFYEAALGDYNVNHAIPRMNLPAS